MDLRIDPDGRTGRHPTKHRDVQQLGTRRLPEQANAPGLIRVDLDKPGFGQRQHMLARHAAGGETERLADFSEARRLTVLGDAIADKGQDGGTAGSQSRHGVHLYSFGFFLARAVSHPMAEPITCGSLLAIAVCQTHTCRLVHRHREQARSHN
ncbi:hypothetical protein D3C85_530860 [compost metagenome]